MKVKNKSPWLATNADETEKVVSKFAVDTNSIVDEGDGVIKFRGGLTITDDSEQFNGTKYDMKSYRVDEYNGQLTADHSSSIESILGKTFGVKKLPRRVVIDGIKFAVKENPLARFAYDMMKAGFLTDFSTETIGAWPDDDGIYHESSLVGLSAVVVGNNKHARINEINQIAANTIKQAEKDGLDASPIKELVKMPVDNSEKDGNNSIMLIKILNHRNFAIKVAFKNAEGEDQSADVAPGEKVEVPVESADSVQDQIKNAVEPVKAADANDIAEVMKNALAPLTAKIEELEKKANKVEEPKFTPAGQAENDSDFAKMGYKELHKRQINAAWDMLKDKKADAGNYLRSINEFNLEQLKKEGIVDNSITISDMGNFVMSPELIKDIQGRRSDFSDLLKVFTFEETLSLQMAWLTRSGDINMQPVEMCDDGADGNLKPISDYSASIDTSNLEELAAVTPVCNAATRFLAVDLLGDLAKGYRTDYDRKRAQLVIIRLQQAVNETGNTNVYTTTSDVNALKAFVTTWSGVAEEIEGGVFIFNTKTYGELLRRMIGAGINNTAGFNLFTSGDQKLILDRPYIVVPNELMPTLNTAETKTFAANGVNVTINKGVFYADPSTWKGRTSGGLSYDFSTEAAYEDGDTVKSAYQRNELVVRGSFFRGGAILDPQKVSSLGSAGVS